MNPVSDAVPATLNNRAVLRIPEFRKLFVAQAVSDLGDGMTFTAILLLVNGLTHSPLALAVLSIAVAVPSMVVGIVAGAYADRLDRRRIMIASDTLRMLLVLGFVTVGTLERLPLLYLVAFAQASVGTFFSPARGALIPRVVPREGLMAANGLGQVARMIAGLTGTALAGLLIATTGSYWPAFVIDASTYAVSVLLVLRVDPALGRIARSEHGIPVGIRSSVATGLRLIAGSPTLLATIAGLSIAMLGLGAVNLLFIPFLIDVLHSSPAWTGPVEGAQTLSMVLAGGLVGTLAGRLSPQRMMVGGIAGVGLVIILLSQAPSVLVLLPIVFLVGWFVMPAQVATQTILQSATNDATRGRVLGAFQASMSTTTIASTAIAGIAAGIIGVREVFLVAGLICLAASGASAVLYNVDRARAARAADLIGSGTVTDESATDGGLASA